MASNLAPGGGPDVEEVLKAARRNRLFGSNGALGAALYRAGRSAEAILRLNRARLDYPGQQVRLVGGTPQDFLFLAMAYHDGGLAPLAAQSLKKAEEQIAGELASGNSVLGRPLEWHDRLLREMLLQEVRSHLKN